MDYRQFRDRFMLRIDKGEEIVQVLKKFCQDNSIRLGTVTGIGAAGKVTLGLFDTQTKKYHSNEYTGDYEICPLTGNITTMKGEVYLHLHANIGDKDNKSISGHLNSATVSATFEAVIDVVDGNLEREFSKEIGLNLYKF
ncbi:MAG: PPC domain-containing DNA-binding protein [Candidatus Woesearchaeota archaeon]